MRTFLGCLSVMSILVMSMSVHAAKQAQKFVLPEFLVGCDVPNVSQECIQKAWDYADVVDDGFLTSAEMARLMRALSNNALQVMQGSLSKVFKEAEFEKAAGFVDAFKVGAQAQIAQQVQLTVLEYDYDGDGKLNQSEFAGEVSSDQSSAIERMIASMNMISDFFDMMDAFNQEKNLQAGIGLSHIDIAPRADMRSDASYLIVSGKIKNNTNEPMDVPPTLVELKDASDQVVISQIFHGIKHLEAGEAISFEVEFKEPPAKARNMTLTFIHENQALN